MKEYKVSQSAEIPASAETVYNILIDYNEGHAAILPKPYFESMTVLEGGVGDGTVIEVQMKVLGVKRTFTPTVREVTANRELVEFDKTAGIETTFFIEPLGADRCRLTISSLNRSADGIAGVIERLTTPPITRHIYRKELENIASYVQG